jgi:hypothetical protein
MKNLLVLTLFALAACGGDHVEKLPKPPENSQVIKNDVPVPVLCKAEIAKAEIAIDKAEEGLKLEEQNAMLRQTIAEQKAYIKALEAGVIGCGGSIK